ncbi:DUF3850 domain-containing protein [Lactococcus lactis]|uniref:DUF3850 domain-containing protein n=1 Tax=Lactococcus lactis TaxID=1358 RepID=UPI00071CBEF2|nr:DUF3850 domain-containing protein [Lactococcus lactis]
MMTVHKKKLDFQFHKPVQTGKKPFEVRINDCDYQVDDIIELKAYGKCCNYCDGKSYKRYYSGNCSGWMNCYESEAETIRVKILRVIYPKQINYDLTHWVILSSSFGKINLGDVRKVLKEYFNRKTLPKDYVVLEIQVMDK